MSGGATALRRIPGAREPGLSVGAGAIAPAPQPQASDPRPPQAT